MLYCSNLVLNCLCFNCSDLVLNCLCFDWSIMVRLSPSKRAKIIDLHREGKSIREIMGLVPCSKRTVELWLNRWKAEQSIENRPHGGGRKRAFDEIEEKQLIDYAKDNRFLEIDFNLVLLLKHQS